MFDMKFTAEFEAHDYGGMVSRICMADTIEHLITAIIDNDFDIDMKTHDEIISWSETKKIKYCGKGLIIERILSEKEKDRLEIEEQKEAARKSNGLVDHLIKLIESNDKRYSFEFAAGGTMEIFDKVDKIGYSIHIEPIEYDENGNALNL